MEDKMETQTQFNKLGDIVGTNTMRFSETSNAMIAALELLENHTSGAPVIDKMGDYGGYISEGDILDRILAGEDLNGLTVKDIMSREHHILDKSTSLENAARFMKERHLHNVSVTDDDNTVYKTVNRHDLLRVLLNADLGIEY